MKKMIREIMMPVLFLGSVFGTPFLIYNAFWYAEANLCIKSGGDPVVCMAKLSTGCQ